MGCLWIAKPFHRKPVPIYKLLNPFIDKVGFLYTWVSSKSYTRIRGGSRIWSRGGPQIVTGLKLPFWGLSFVEFWCWGLIFGGQGGAQAPGAPPWIRPWEYCGKSWVITNLFKIQTYHSTQERCKAYGTPDKALLALYLLYLNKMWLKFELSLNWVPVELSLHLRRESKFTC